MRISFYKRGKTIQAKISDGKDILRVSTGIKIPDHLKFRSIFLGESEEVARMNHELMKYKLKLYHDYPLGLKKVDNENDLILLAEKYVTLMEKDMLGSRKLSAGTKKVYRYAVKLLKEYGQPYVVEAIDNNYDNQKKKAIVNRFNEYFKGFESWMVDRRMTMKTRESIMASISVMLNYWSKELFILLPKLNFSRSKENPIVVLDDDLVSKFLKDNRGTNDEMRYTWEVCCMILLTSMRIDDAVNVSSPDLQFSDGVMHIMKENRKTGYITNAPLPKMFSDIIKKNMDEFGRPYSMPANINVVYANIKPLFAMYEEMHDVVSIKKYGVDGEVVTTKPFYEQVHPHMLRKTAITHMLQHGVSERHVKFLSCHKSSAFERYVAFVEKKFNSEVVNYHKAMYVDNL